jgi:hypothetical protein
MQRKQQVGECWVCVIFFACVCVGTSDSTTASDDPKFLLSLCRVHWALPRGVPGGAGMPPPCYAQRSGQNFFLGVFFIFRRILLFLAVF